MSIKNAVPHQIKNKIKMVILNAITNASSIQNSKLMRAAGTINKISGYLV